MTEFTLIPASGGALPAEPFTGRHLIAGQWTDSADGATYERVSPSHVVPVSRSAKGGEAEVRAAIAAARRAFDKGDWAFSPGKDRSTIQNRVADLIDREREPIARIEELESGKPIAQARGEIEGASDIWR
ncbi:MAG: aldehyde dehydrogenase family protein, partial [Paracoccus sp. (in: a-proteobacteria)]